MNSQFAKSHHLIAVKGQEGRAVRRITHLDGKIVAVYAEDSVPGTDDVKPVLCALIALPDGTEMSPVPENETRLASRSNESRFPGEYTLPEGGTEYLVRLRDGVELTFVHHADVNKSTLIWATAANAEQQRIFDADWIGRPDPLGMEDE